MASSPILNPDRISKSPGVPAAGYLTAEIEALQHTVGELEKERDFYYGKLRSVELLCQSTEENPDSAGEVVGICREILAIMYDDPPDSHVYDIQMQEGAEGLRVSPPEHLGESHSSGLTI